MPSTNNKVKFGLKNCHYAKATLDPDTNAVTFATPVAIPGAVNLSLDPEGDTEPFYADDMVYYTTVANNGYSGDLEIALIPDSLFHGGAGAFRSAFRVLRRQEKDQALYVLLHCRKTDHRRQDQ